MDRPAAEIARRVALAHLAAVRAARERLEDPTDAEALHDLRVAVRRLRSCVRTFRDELADSVTWKRRRWLRRLARATGAGRDAEVQLAWIDRQLPTLTRRQRTGAAWLRRRLTTVAEECDAALRARLARDFTPRADRLRDALSCWRLTVCLDEETAPPRAGPVLGARLLMLVDALERALGRVTGVADQNAAHRARIATKRLRYAVEPLSSLEAGAAPLVRRLSGLQDVLGDLHDAHVLSGVAADALEIAARDAAHRLAAMVRDGAPLEGVRPGAAGSQDPRPGLLELARRLHTQSESLFATFAAEWLHGDTETFLRDARALAARLG